MMSHSNSVFVNSCVKRPVDPLSKMPKTAYEKKSSIIEQGSIDSSSTIGSISVIVDEDCDKLKDFYRSIPDYNDINHLPHDEFYSTLQCLREKKKVILGLAVDKINGCSAHLARTKDPLIKVPTKYFNKNSSKCCRKKDETNQKISKFNTKTLDDVNLLSSSLPYHPSLKHPIRKPIITTNKNKTKSAKNYRPKRDHSSCSITWNDIKNEKCDVDQKFKQFFDLKSYCSPKRNPDDDDFKTRSMPSSPLRSRRTPSPLRKSRNITIPKPFKMTERDEEEKIVSELRSLKKSFSADALNQKYERKHFKANPVPIESRIPLYNKILEDQAMRRAITKINSEAELRAQMKPFSFTEREQTAVSGLCERAAQIIPKARKKKRFKARPVPKNLFSNYFYDKMKQEQFFRNMNRQIRAEEMLRAAQLPGTMAMRDRSRLSTPAAHSDLPIDPSPLIPSTTSSDRQRPKSPNKARKARINISNNDFITTSPQPFKFNTADRAAKKMEKITKKIYQDSKSTESFVGSGSVGPRAYSALDLRAAASGRSNLAALLRAEAVRRRFEFEAASRLVEQRKKIEKQQRDRLLRSKPSWHLVKNNHEEDIAMRLQTRRDEERMRNEEFQHEMELMYGRVQQQPMLFERYYAPRSHNPIEYIEISSIKPCERKRSSKKKKGYSSSPNRSRKVSINDTIETYNADVMEYLHTMDKSRYSDSEVASVSFEDCKTIP